MFRYFTDYFAHTILRGEHAAAATQYARCVPSHYSDGAKTRNGEGRGCRQQVKRSFHQCSRWMARARVALALLLPCVLHCAWHKADRSAAFWRKRPSFCYSSTESPICIEKLHVAQVTGHAASSQ